MFLKYPDNINNNYVFRNDYVEHGLNIVRTMELLLSSYLS